MIDTLLTAFALVLIIEGLVPALFPNKWQNYLIKLTQQPTSSIRNIGMSLLFFGVIILWLVSK
ncbi:MAG: hypothetical protein ACI9N3_002723 [Colwellia sp.]|jgi:uncharacterized protein YjeT (DUF2065 family)|uniref:DUF2065 domain-containing protein n=1 Tax=Colwellia sp. Bg11-12 TaxID=2759817 RepID=UPI0015F383DA|nr:DUF2065 domain-containing protein [Colwellia sp. Bg11-12]MBA6265193.1 DUF2065 domain-containing protein [Colwellia sp. Bg11-12]